MRPKQFLSLLGEQSLLQESYSRARRLADPERIMVFTNADLAPLVGHQLPELAPQNIVAEPARRDTAAAVCLAALLVQHRYGDAVMVILTADHRIEPLEEFARVITSACDAAARGTVLYTIGVPPDHAATAYGYLEAGGPLPDEGGVIHRKVRSFREKPDRNTADRYLKVGGYLWNSGMFVWRTSVVLAAYAEHLPGHLALLAPAVEAEGKAARSAALAEAFPRLPSVSVDYGIMEKVDNVRLVEATFTWNDLGSWPALAELLPRDEADNAYRGRIAVHDAAANVVFCDDEGELVGLVGVSNLVVVRAGGRTLVAARDRVEEIKDLVRLLERDGWKEDL